MSHQIMQSNQDSNDSLCQPSKGEQKMKIVSYSKSYIIKASSLFMLVSFIAGTPAQANAGFFNDLVASVIGSSAQADETAVDAGDGFGTDNFTNSQNMPVLGTSSIDPDTKNVNSTGDVTIMDGGVLSSESSNGGAGLESVSNGEISTYIVQEGDTLSEIAQQFDISINTIKWANNITGNSIKVGQKLDILPVTGVKHIIKKGDTLSKIATKYDAETDDIKVFNGIDTDSQLKVGEILYVPNGIIKAPEPVKKPTSSSGSSSGSGSSVVVSSGYYKWPVSGGRITSSYGPRKLGYHYGVDIGAPRGTTVFAAASGTVVETVSYCVEGRTSCGGRYGNYIVIQHSNGTFTRYAHLQRVSVSVGDDVSKGEKIGTVGNTGRSTGPHLHYQIEKSNGSTIRPKF